MFTNHLKIALRYFFRQKTYSIINILGLAVGIAATLLILSYVEFELSYDNFQKNGGSLYRISVMTTKEGKVLGDGPQFTPPIGPAMLTEFPEVENFVRISNFGEATFTAGNNVLRVSDITYADTSFFDLLSFQLVAGDPRRVLVEPYSIVLTEQAALGLFGGSDPIGKMVKADNKDLFKVTGIVKAPPANSHIQYGALVSFATLYKNPNLFLDWNGGNRYITYLKLRPNALPRDVEARLPDFMWAHINRETAASGLLMKAYLQPMPRIHLFSDRDSGALRTNLTVFGLIALFILLIACVNFVNLTTARVARRSKEIGMRKVLGADRSMLVKQFLSESILITLLASIVAIVLVEISFPVFRNLVAKNLDPWSVFEPRTLAGLVGIIVVVGVIAGSYPAFYLSSLQAAQTLKGPGSDPGRKGMLRGLLIVLQFGISIALIVCTVIVANQLHYMKNKDLGFNRENILRIPLIGDDAQLTSTLLKQELLRVPGVVSVSASSDVPYNDFTSNGYLPQGEQTVMMIHVVDIDDDYFKTFGINVIEGRAFSKDFPSDRSAYMVNQTLVRTLGWKNPIGKMIIRDNAHSIIGVVKDFNYAKLNSPVEPLILTQQPWRGRYDFLSVKIQSPNVAASVEAIGKVWSSLVPSTPFQYAFLDEEFDRLYKSEERFEQTFLTFSALGIFIALMGLLSLASLSTEQRTKEIGIRKALGASALSVTGLLSGYFLKWVLVANVLAWPAAYYFMSRWLEDFAYRIDITVWPFVAAGAISIVLGWLSVSFQTIRAAMTNPVEALRYE
ncbi:MAG: ABC transporter permease [Bacteroidota bacterium]|jgi:putative ABC transport system permease protein